MGNMDLLNVLLWIVFGAIAGTVANVIDPAPSRGGIIGSVVLGIVGALIGGYLANLILGVTVTGFNFTSLIIAILGSLLLLMVGRALRQT